METPQQDEPEAREQIVIFYIRLPFDLPIADGIRYDPRYSNDPSDAFRLQLTVVRTYVTLRDATLCPYESGLACLDNKYDPDEGKNEGSSRQTWVIATTTNRVYDDDPREILELPGGAESIGFERCLHAINVLIGASQIVTKHYMMRSISKEALDSEITYDLIDAETQEHVARYKMRIHIKKYNEGAASFSIEEAQQISEVIGYQMQGDAEGKPHPLLLARRLYVEARSHLMQGNPMATIIMLQTAAERYLFGIYELLLTDAGESRENIDRLLRKDGTSFNALIKDRLPHLLHGTWWDSKTSPVSRYEEYLYNVRNKAIHAGIEPHWQEIQPAFTAYDELVRFVEEQVRKRPKALTRTLLAITDPFAGGEGDAPKSVMRAWKRMNNSRYWRHEEG